jgi:hypothetical protein
MGAYVSNNSTFTKSLAVFFSWLLFSPPFITCATWTFKDGTEHAPGVDHPFYPPGDRVQSVQHSLVTSVDKHGHVSRTDPLVVFTGPTVKKFDPLPKKPAEILRSPVVNGVLQQVGVLMYTPFFSQAFSLDLLTFLMYTFLTLIPAGALLAGTLLTLRYNALRSASRNLRVTSEVERPVIRDPLNAVG